MTLRGDGSAVRIRWIGLGALVASCGASAAAVATSASQVAASGGAPSPIAEAAVAPTSDMRSARRAPRLRAAYVEPSPTAAVHDDVLVLLEEGTRVALDPEVFTGRVLDPDGEPLGGVDVELISTWLPDCAVEEFWSAEPGQCATIVTWPGARSSTRSASDGTFRLRYYEFGDRVLSARGPGVAPWIASVRGRGSAEIRLRDADEELHGRVVDDEARPISGATVRLRASAQPTERLRGIPASWMSPEWEGVTRTGADGEWTMRGAPGGLPTLTVDADGFTGRVERCWTVATGGTLTLFPAVRREGRVVDADTGAPVAHAQLWLQDWRDVAKTDQEGRFAVDSLPDVAREIENGSVTRGPEFFVLAAGYELKSVDPDGRDAPIAVQLRRTATVRARVSDSDGRPVPGAILVARRASAGRTDAEGEVELDVVPGSADLYVYVDGACVETLVVRDLAPRDERDLGAIVVSRR